MAGKNQSGSVPVKRGDKAKSTGGQLLRPFEDIDALFDRFIQQVHPEGWHLRSRRDWSELPQPFSGKRPNVDVINRDNEIVVRAELPGVDKKDLDVTMNDSTVTIKATSSHEKEETRDDYYRSEIARGSFARVVALPCEVDDGKTTARFKNGVLELTMPKLAKARRRKVTVQ